VKAIRILGLILSYLLAGLFGFSLAKVSNHFAFGPSPVVDSKQSAYSVTLGGISSKDDWIHSYDVYFIPLNSIKSEKTFAVLILIPQSSRRPRGSIEMKRTVFNLTGFSDGSIRPVTIEDASFDRSNPYVLLLDLLDNHTFQNDNVKVALKLDSTN
jgi:hypothetical protein